jgi:hypothetical protein
MELIIAIVLAFVAGGIAGLWRASQTTGQSMLSVLRGKPGEERKQSQRGKPGEEGPP